MTHPSKSSAAAIGTDASSPRSGDPAICRNVAISRLNATGLASPGYASPQDAGIQSRRAIWHEHRRSPRRRVVRAALDAAHRDAWSCSVSLFRAPSRCARALYRGRTAARAIGCRCRLSSSATSPSAVAARRRSRLRSRGRSRERGWRPGIVSRGYGGSNGSRAPRPAELVRVPIKSATSRSCLPRTRIPGMDRARPSGGGARAPRRASGMQRRHRRRRPAALRHGAHGRDRGRRREPGNG